MTNINEVHVQTHVVQGGPISGFLRRAKRKGKTSALRRKRWFTLDGAIFSKHNYESAEASWCINIQGSEVLQQGKTHFEIIIQKNPENREAACDFEQNRIILHAKTEDDCIRWVRSLKYASKRRVQDLYNIGPLIGSGGFAEVRLAKCMLSGESRAIKTMQKSEAYAKLFGTEIAIIKKVDHPNIVKTYDVFESSSHIHIVMEYLEGGMLYDAIEDGIRFEEEDIAQFMQELIDGILYLHDLGIVHRDIKPENVLCKSKHPPLHLKIADFGLASLSSVAGHRADQMLMSTMIGTPEFIAPEIARRERYTDKVDIWALGMLCYNVICGALPVDETKDIFPQLLNGIPLTFPEKEWNSYSELARSFVGAMLCHDPERRLSPLGCLVHPWLERNRQQKSNKVGAHGRVSKLLFSQEPYERFRSQRTGLLPEACAISSRFKSSLEVKRCWKIAYLTVAAVNRFDWVVHPDPDMKYTCSRSQQGGESKSRISDVGNFEKMNEKSYDSNMQDLDLGTWGSDSEDDSSLGVSFLSKSEIDEQRSQKLMKEIEAKKQQVNLHADGPRKVQSWDLTKRKDELNEGIDDGTRKSKIRKKILRVLSPETEKRLGPVRKLSRKLGLSSADNKKTSAKLSEEASADFDLELKELNVLSLHDDEIQGLDDIDDHDMSAPASLFGKKHKHLMKLSRNRGMPVSPMTPRKKTSSKALFH